MAGTITSGAIASADKDKNSDPFSAIVNAINNLADIIKNKQTTVTVNAPQGPPGTSVTVTPEPPGANCANGGVKLTSASGINYVCNGGSSTQTCSSGQTMCSGVCSNLSTDTNNCGGCAHVCPSGDSCVSGACTIASCPTGQVMCGNTCSDISSDPNHCGNCGKVCATGQVCVSGQCTGGPTCPAGQTLCSGVCKSLQTDPTSCGSCGAACFTPNGTPACSVGQCRVAVCNAGFADCDQVASNGCETNTSTDPHNCGACGNTCFTPNGIPACSAGQCTVAACNPGFANCDGNNANGCETNIQTDTHNCGACGHACSTGQTCTAGVCH